jgi:mRNA interferase MazF
LVISDGPVGEGAALVWVLMITSAENRRWAGDIPLGPDQEMAGLSSASVIRPCKIATVDAADLHPLGRISSALQEETRGAVASLLRNASSQGPGRAGS